MSADLVGYLGFRSSGVEVRGNSAFDIALWDIFGKATGQPVAQLLGGFSRQSIRTYNTCAGTEYIKDAKGQTTANYGLGAKQDYDDLNGFLHRAGELAEELLEDGITAMKIWPFDHAAEKTRGQDISAADLKAALEPFEKIRKAVGDRIDIMVEFHSMWQLLPAIKIAKALAPFATYWHEDPIRMDSLSDLKRYEAASPAPICGVGDARQPLGLPRPARDRCGRHHHARHLVVRRPLRGAQDRGDGGSLAAAGRAARLHRPGRARRVHASVAQRAQRARPGERAGILPDLVPRSGDRAAGSEGRHDHRAARTRAGAGAQSRARPRLHRPPPRLRRCNHLMISTGRTTMKRLTSILLLGTALAAGASAASAQEPMNIVFTHHSSASNPFWQAVKKGFDDACAKIQANCQMIFTQTEGSIEQQSANMQAALSSKPDALITSIVDNNAFDQIIADARAAGVTVIASNVDDTEGAAGNARQAFIGQGFIPAGYELGKKMSEFFPKEGKIKALVGVSAPGQNWSEQRAAGVMKFLEEFKAANAGREVVIERLDTGTDGAVVADRVGAYLSANPDTTVYFDTGLWHAYVAQVLVDRGVEPGKVLMGGFDIVAEVLQQMEAGYIQVQVDQQPYMQGFMPVMEAYLAKTVGLAPADIDTGKGVVLKEDVPKLMELAKQGVR